MRISDLAGRRVALLGFGVEGRSTLAAIRSRLAEQPVTVLDQNPLPAEAAAALAADPAVAVCTGDGALDDLAGFEVIVKSPGVSPYRGPAAAALIAARAAGAIVTSATELWFGENPGATVVAVTGTKGKSTTASLIAHLLAAAGRRVALVGNIGSPMLELVAQPPVPPPELWVMELSSYQIQDLHARPAIAVLLNLFPEHLDWHGSAERYFEDKTRLVQPSATGAAPRAVVLDAQDPETRRRFGGPENPTIETAVWFNHPAGLHVAGERGVDEQILDGDRPILPAGSLHVPGRHNLSNLCAALTAVRLAGVDPAAVAPAVERFRGLPHRLCVLGEREGVSWVDDSISTTPQSARAAVEAFPGRPITLLLGGHDRGLDYGDLARFLVARPVETVLTLPDSGPRIAAAIRQARTEARVPEEAPPRLVEAADLAAAVAEARRTTPAGGVVLLSPAAPSFGRFRDYRQRGERFAELAGFPL